MTGVLRESNTDFRRNFRPKAHSLMRLEKELAGLRGFMFV